MATILIADDDPDIAELARRSVARHGHDVRVVHDGARALANAGPADLVILDVSMPSHDGPEVAALLREAPHTADVAILMLSTVRTADGITAALTAGADDYLTKPFNPFELERRVDRLLATAPADRRFERDQARQRRRLASA